ncbi:hypothetical protein B0T20DRAFT_417870 [Sordaria brevicollis]|uniref:Secreted protein n=1 Tax=Sordaria brevicollis TaxID=83679 RepID=A0AAE0PAR2_SORBR|nr:hypothetical protein B0T20DRAFT_417870 [Sordaria brevicollis]
MFVSLLLCHCPAAAQAKRVGKRLSSTVRVLPLFPNATGGEHTQRLRNSASYKVRASRSGPSPVTCTQDKKALPTRFPVALKESAEKKDVSVLSPRR